MEITLAETKRKLFDISQLLPLDLQKQQCYDEYLKRKCVFAFD